MTTFFMIKEHPSNDLIMIQVDNKAIQLNSEQQLRVYEVLKDKFNQKR